MEIFRRIQSADGGVQKCDVCTCRDNCWQSVNFFIKKKNMYRFKKLQ